MLFCDLLRVTVLLVAGVATALGAIGVVVANRDLDTAALIVGFAWWTLAAATGLVLGTTARAGDDMAAALASARTATSLPSVSAGRIMLQRLWPIGAFAILVGVLGLLWPQVAVIGAGYAILMALFWRRREHAVAAIEERDGVRFYVEASSALRPVQLVRTPGLYRDRPPRAKPPPPPPVEAG
jgi:hypothetical protein